MNKETRILALMLDALRRELRAAALQITASNGKVQGLLSEKEWEEARATIKGLKYEADETAREAFK